MARITVRLTPRGGRDAIEGWRGGILLARVSAPPVDGKANEALVRLLSRALKLPRSRVSIIMGEQARTKQIEIEGLTAEDVRAALA